MIYCVIPPELKDELYEKLVEYYKDNPNVEVIVDRRSGPDRRQGTPGAALPFLSWSRSSCSASS